MIPNGPGFPPRLNLSSRDGDRRTPGLPEFDQLAGGGAVADKYVGRAEAGPRLIGVLREGLGPTAVPALVRPCAAVPVPRARRVRHRRGLTGKLRAWRLPPVACIIVGCRKPI